MAWLAWLDQKCQFWASYRDSNETPFSCWKRWSVRLQLAARGKNVLFLPQNLDIWGQKSIFCLVIAIFVDGTNDHYTRGYNFPIGTTPKKISVSELGVIFWGSPLFLAVFGHSHVRGATTLNFGPISTKLGGIVRVIKKMTQKDNGPGPGRNYGETAAFMFSRNCETWVMALTDSYLDGIRNSCDVSNTHNHYVARFCQEDFLMKHLFLEVSSRQ